MTIYVQKVTNVLTDDSATFDCTLTDSVNHKYVCLSFDTEAACDAFIAAAVCAMDVERSEDRKA
jgi:hypothetical protein